MADPSAYLGPMTSDTDPHALLYRQIDPDGALRLTSDLLGKCDDGELYLQFSASEAFAFDDGRLKTADYSRDSGFGLRGVSGETTGFAHANEISHKAIARAGETLTLGQAMLSGGVAGLDAGLTVQVGGRDVTCPVLRQ